MFKPTLAADHSEMADMDHILLILRFVEICVGVVVGMDWQCRHEKYYPTTIHWLLRKENSNILNCRKVFKPVTLLVYLNWDNLVKLSLSFNNYNWFLSILISSFRINRHIIDRNLLLKVLVSVRLLHLQATIVQIILSTLGFGLELSEFGVATPLGA